MLMKIRKEDYPLLYEKAFELYKKSKGDDLKDFPEEIRNEFLINGNRVNFEKLYFRRRDYLSSVAILTLFDDKYIYELESVILAICDEKSWMLPAHIIHGNGFVDLFVAEASFALAEICTVFSEKLSPQIHSRVRDEIRKRLVDRYLSDTFWWESCEMNWAGVCAGYIGGTLLYLFPEVFQNQKRRIIKTLDCYIKGFADDGFCLEGPLYWQYGFTAYTVFADLLYKHSGGKEDLFADEKARNISSYGINCLLKGDTSLSFSDADRSFKPDYALMHFLHKKFPDKGSLPSQEKLCFYDANTKWMNYYRAVLWSDSSVQESAFRESEIYSPSSHQLIINKPSYSFAIKGGHNNEPHNHNDLGSFIFSDEDGQVFCDLGSGRYTKDYFDESKRYSIFCNSSFSHSVPIIDGKGQSEGKSFRAPLLYENGKAICNMTKAYDIKALVSLERKIDLTESSVLINDSFSLNEEVSITERFISLNKAEIKDGKLIFGSTAFIYPENSVFLSVKEEKHTPHEYDREDITVYCYDFVLKSNVSSITFEIKTENK